MDVNKYVPVLTSEQIPKWLTTHWDMLCLTHIMRQATSSVLHIGL